MHLMNKKRKSINSTRKSIWSRPPITDNATGWFKTFLKKTYNQTRNKNTKTEFVAKVSTMQTSQDAWIREITKPMHSVNSWDEERNPDVILTALSNFKWFSRYKHFYMLDENALRKSCHYFQYKKYRKGDYIFHLGTSSTIFYGIIKGTISIRGLAAKKFEYIFDDDDPEFLENNGDETGKRKKEFSRWAFIREYAYSWMNLSMWDEAGEADVAGVAGERGQGKPELSPDEWRYELEYEKTKFYQGMCLGEWGILNGDKRTASAYCLEDTDIFFLTKDYFLNFLSDTFTKSIKHKKEFLSAVIPRLGHYLSVVVPWYFDSGDIIYTNNEIAEDIFIVYQGSCALSNGEKVVWTYIEPRGIAGLESVNNFGIYRKERGRYNEIWTAIRNFTVVYRVSLPIFWQIGFNIVDEIAVLNRQHSRIIGTRNTLLEQQKRNNEFIVGKNSKMLKTDPGKDAVIERLNNNFRAGLEAGVKEATVGKNRIESFTCFNKIEWGKIAKMINKKHTPTDPRHHNTRSSQVVPKKRATRQTLFQAYNWVKECYRNKIPNYESNIFLTTSTNNTSGVTKKTNFSLFKMRNLSHPARRPCRAEEMRSKTRNWKQINMKRRRFHDEQVLMDKYVNSTFHCFTWLNPKTTTRKGKIEELKETNYSCLWTYDSGYCELPLLGGLGVRIVWNKAGRPGREGGGVMFNWYCK